MDVALARFEEQSQETISRISQDSDKRKAEQDAQRRVSKAKRDCAKIFRPRFFPRRMIRGRIASSRCASSRYKSRKASACA